jgi:hypothetical protein
MNTRVRNLTQLPRSSHLLVRSPNYGPPPATGRTYGVQPDAALKLATTQLAKVRAEIGKIIVGQQDVEDGYLSAFSREVTSCSKAPGLGKTTLLRTLARVMDLKYSRIQFTPGLIPADVVGSGVRSGDNTLTTFRVLPAHGPPTTPNRAVSPRS